MTSVRDAANAAMNWKLLAEAVAHEYGTTRTDALLALAGEGVERVRVSDDNLDFGTVSVVGGGKVARVTDERALFEWVRKNRPDELSQIINPAFVESIKKICEDEGVAVYKPTGEVIPGVELVDGTKTLRISPTRDATEGARRLVREFVSGDLRMIGPA